MYSITTIVTYRTCKFIGKYAMWVAIVGNIPTHVVYVN